jgi:hypothetical protein
MIELNSISIGASSPHSPSAHPNRFQVQQLPEFCNLVGNVPDSNRAVVGRAAGVPAIDKFPGATREAVKEKSREDDERDSD